MPLKDFLDNYNFNAEEFDFDAFKTAAKTEFDKDEGIYAAKISQLEENGTKAANDLREQKLKNYDLLQQIPGDSTTKSGAPVPDADNDRANTITVDDLFHPKKEE